MVIKSIIIIILNYLNIKMIIRIKIACLIVLIIIEIIIIIIINNIVIIIVISNLIFGFVFFIDFLSINISMRFLLKLGHFFNFLDLCL